MSVSPVSGAQSVALSEPPPPPPLSPVQQGDIDAGRARVVDGQVFAIGDRNAPPTSTWGDQPAGTAYRQTYDAVAARLGTTDRATVTAEIDRQLYGAQPAPAATATPAAAPESGEGIGSFFEGAIKGDLGNNNNWSALAGQTVVGFIPVVGQIADIRDTGAAIGQVIRGEQGGWTALGAAAIGWIPGIGDAAKGGIRAANNVVDAGSDVAQRQVDEVAQAATRPEIVMNGGTRGDWPRELNARNLQPNTDYVVNGYRYATDARGRVTSVEGRLDLQTAERNGYQQSVAGRADRLPNDQGGHLIASIFNGPGDRLNLVPMNGNLNTSRWKAMENGLASALREGRNVEVKIDVLYASTGGRPLAFRVEQRIDGEVTRQTFRNQAGG